MSSPDQPQLAPQPAPAAPQFAQPSAPAAPQYAQPSAPTANGGQVAFALQAPTAYPPFTPPGLKDVGVAYILLIFLGAVGGHRFYLGKIGTAILWLLTGGLLGIGVLVDIFTMNSQVRAANAKLTVRS